MSKYKVGDKVRVLETARDGWYNGEVKIGAVGTVDRVRYDSEYNCKVSNEEGWEWLSEDDLEPVRKSLDNLQVGDILLASLGVEKRVIDVLPNSVVLSETSSHDVVDAVWSNAELKDKGWTVKQDTPNPETVEFSVSELEEKLGIKPGTLRVKKDD